MSKKCANVRVLAGVEQYIRAGQLQERMEGRKKDYKREGKRRWKDEWENMSKGKNGRKKERERVGVEQRKKLEKE